MNVRGVDAEPARVLVAEDLPDVALRDAERLVPLVGLPDRATSPDARPEQERRGDVPVILAVAGVVRGVRPKSDVTMMYSLSRMPS